MMDQKPRSRVILDEIPDKPTVPVTDSTRFKQDTHDTISPKPTITPKSRRSGRIVRLADRFMFLESLMKMLRKNMRSIHVVVRGMPSQLTDSGF